MQVAENGRCLFQRRTIVVGESGVKRLAAPDRLFQRAHRLLERRVGVHPVMVENIDIVKAHSHERLIEAREQVLAASPVSVGALPHRVAGLRGDDHLIPVGKEVLPHDPAEVLLGAARLRAVVVGQVKVRDPVVKSSKAELLHVGIHARIAEVVPQPERHRGEHEAAPAAAVVFHRFISLLARNIHLRDPPFM